MTSSQRENSFSELQEVLAEYLGALERIGALERRVSTEMRPLVEDGASIDELAVELDVAREVIERLAGVAASSSDGASWSFDR